ncbi:hypothetical protein NEUTE1DRAFT_118217 [Neurospora tetrasperma FGSC 2508]|uniref:Uncharacterized protein n=1 Tax=Neurospora tetrasperma (strain FGSC 2508 / ATCC MYA-4615 / P0657) TaxID=510951 RepID=F8MXQ5_NEUT8|nr:uncharacterized protein NEUTE1DRAFT_118217 [Neurospora tetrasperma FGSC 2508]EGO54526.1 hypothetical protein NEUTE1DRAFT_118217 [Neurospora tetrasperma FGSC 2508]EGZ68021.1 hypothetical protein NEUTE2DRAFT_145816 [Neurospora tetrasperma FGSC 2509]
MLKYTHNPLSMISFLSLLRLSVFCFYLFCGLDVGSPWFSGHTGTPFGVRGLD